MAKKEIEIILRARDQASTVMASVLSQARAMQGMQLNPFGRLLAEAERTDALRMMEVHERALEQNRAVDAQRIATRQKAVEAAQGEAVAVNRLWDAEHKRASAIRLTARAAQEAQAPLLSLRGIVGDLGGVALPMALVLGAVGAAFRGLEATVKNVAEAFRGATGVVDLSGRVVAAVAGGINVALRSIPLLGPRVLAPIQDFTESICKLMDQRIPAALSRLGEAFADLDAAIKTGQATREAAAKSLQEIADRAERGAALAGKEGLERELEAARQQYEATMAAIEEEEKKYWGQTPRMPGMMSDAGARAAARGREEYDARVYEAERREEQQLHEERNENYRQEIEGRVARMRELGELEIRATLRGAEAKRASLKLEQDAERELNRVRYVNREDQERKFALQRKILEQEIAEDQGRAWAGAAAAGLREIDRLGRAMEGRAPEVRPWGMEYRPLAAVEAMFLHRAPGAEAYPAWSRDLNRTGQEQTKFLARMDKNLDKIAAAAEKPPAAGVMELV